MFEENFYTFYTQYKDSILYRGIINGKRITVETKAVNPTIYIPSVTEEPYKCLFGTNLKPKSFKSFSETKDYIKMFDGVSGSKIYGVREWDLQWIGQKFPDEIKYDYNKIRTFFIDIETTPSDEGFPDPATAKSEITVITVYSTIEQKYFSFTIMDVINYRGDDLVLRKFNTEKEMLAAFVAWWKSDYPDTVTGWYSNSFDIPYIFTRLSNVFSQNFAKGLSPFDIVNSREDGMTGNISYDIYGVELLDYLNLYKKFKPGGRESYKLGYIAQLEIGETKLEYEGTMGDFFLRDPQGFFRYNVVDVEVLVKMDKKLKMLSLQTEMAYSAKINYSQAESPVRLWTAIIYNYMIENKLVFEPHVRKTKERSFEGAYVKEPIAGLYDWVVTFDATSLYPSMIVTLNISPETMVQPEDVPEELKPYYRRRLVDEMSSYSIPQSVSDALKKHKMCLAANGQLFRTEKIGVIPLLIKRVLDSRSLTKKDMITSKKRIEAEVLSEDDIFALKTLIGSLGVREQGLKVSANALYGATGNVHFPMFDIWIAEAITMSGQVSNKGIQVVCNDFMEKMKFPKADYIKAGDTDSVFFDLGLFVEKFKPTNPLDFVCSVADGKIQDVIDKGCEDLWAFYNSPENRLSFKREKVIETICLLDAKKRYCCKVLDSEGVRYSTPDITFTGLETNRSSTPKFARDMLKDVFTKILNKDREGALSFLDEQRPVFDTLSLETIALPRGVSDMNKYADTTENGIYLKGAPIHVKAALNFNHQIKEMKLNKKYKPINSGDKIRFIPLVPNPYKAEVMGWADGELPTEMHLEKWVDRESIWEKNVVDPLTSLATAIGWVVKKEANLSAFF